MEFNIKLVPGERILWEGAKTKEISKELAKIWYLLPITLVFLLFIPLHISILFDPSYTAISRVYIHISLLAVNVTLFIIIHYLSKDHRNKWKTERYWITNRMITKITKSNTGHKNQQVVKFRMKQLTQYEFYQELPDRWINRKLDRKVGSLYLYDSYVDWPRFAINQIP